MVTVEQRLAELKNELLKNGLSLDDLAEDNTAGQKLPPEFIEELVRTVDNVSDQNSLGAVIRIFCPINVEKLIAWLANQGCQKAIESLRRSQQEPTVKVVTWQ